jgi:hypothetical protein
VTMNAASMASLVVFFIEPTRLWLPTRVKAKDGGVGP